jgi:NADH-quinone oxidoreductase subunit N
MTAGAFAVVIIFENSDLISLDIKRYSGIGYKYPFIAASMSFFLLSFAGIPVTSGFMGKFYVFSSAVKSGYNWLVVIALLNSAFAAFYYIKIIVKMYMPDKEPAGASISRGKIDEGLMITIIICLILTLLMGIFPQIFINFANNSVFSLWRI